MAQQYKDSYVFDIDYVSGYYRELSPLFINFCLLANSIEPPSIDEEFTYCELGCGRTTSLLIMASNYPNGTFYGIDFSPSHIKHGQYMAKKANLKNIHFFSISFDEALKRKKEFPNFDYIVFHGIYSWIDKKVRKTMLKFCDKKLKTGGVVYNSYNSFPGCLHRAQIQKLFLETSHTSVNRSDVRMMYSLKIVEEFLNEKPMTEQKGLINALEVIKKQNTVYLSHEYLNLQWNACYFIDVEREFSKKSLNYVNIANPVEAFSSYTLPPDINKFLSKYFTTNTPIFEHFKDHILNRAFRKDLYVKGIKRHDVYQLKNILKKYKFIFSNPNHQLDKNVKHQWINIKIKDDDLSHLQSKLQKGAFFDELMIGKDFSLTLLYVSLFVSNGVVDIIDDRLNNNHSPELNRVLCEEASSSTDMEFISAFKTKNAVQVDLLDRLFYKFYDKDNLPSMLNKIEDYLINEINVKINSNNDPIETRGFLEKRFEHWQKVTLPIWIKTGVLMEE